MERPLWHEQTLREDQLGAYWTPCAPESTFCIDIDLDGKRPTRRTALLAFSEKDIPVQEPNSAQLFLCNSSSDARLLFTTRRNRHALMTLEYTQHNITASQPIESWLARLNDPGILASYDYRSLYKWLSLEPGQNCALFLTDHILGRAQTLAEGFVINSQIHLSRGTDNNFTVVWFDFRDVSDAYASFQHVEGIVATLQRRFWYRSGQYLNDSMISCTDFPGLLLLEIVGTDLAALESLILRDPRSKPVATLAPTSQDYVDDYLDGFELTQSLMRRAEGLQRLVNYMRSEQALSHISDAAKSTYSKASYQLEMGSLLLLENIRRREEIAAKRLDLSKLVAQRHQASSMAALTYCAAFFLPLSLSGTFLSMQSRAKDLDMIFYDFLGIAAVFCSIAALAYVGSHLMMDRLSSWAAKRREVTNSSPLSPWIRGFFGVEWLLVTLSFLLGMFYDFRTGITILGSVGVAAAVFVSFILSLPTLAPRVKGVVSEVSKFGQPVFLPLLEAGNVLRAMVLGPLYWIIDTTVVVIGIRSLSAAFDLLGDLYEGMLLHVYRLLTLAWFRRWCRMIRRAFG